jgi:DNA-directed RNA polymerase subunit D
VNVEVLEIDDREIKLRVDGATNTEVNALRRTMMTEVPTLAIEDVTIYDNRSALFDEVIAHRLGMLPVPTDDSLFAEWDIDEDPQEQTEEGRGEILYTLTFEGPGTVRAKDLTPATEDEEAEIAEPEVPIVKLGRDQRLMLEATAVLGTGEQHSKWQPVNAVGYREVPTVEITGDLGLSPEETSELESMAPDDALTFSGGEPEIVDEVEAHDFLYNVDGHFDLDNVEFGEEGEDAFFLSFETDGSMHPKTVLRQAIAILDGKLAAVHEEAAELQ